MKIKDLEFELINKGKYEYYKAEGIKQEFIIEENKNVNPIKWGVGMFNSFSSFEEAKKWANAVNLKHFNQEIGKCQNMINDWETK